MNGQRRRPLLRTGAVLALALCGPAAGSARAERREAPPFPPGGETPLAALQDIDVVEHTGDKIPGGLVFRDPDGGKVEIDALLGNKPLLVTLGYYRCPMLCGMVLEGLGKAMKGSGLVPGRDFQALSISIDPTEDAKLARETGERVRRGLSAPPAKATTATTATTAAATGTPAAAPLPPVAASAWPFVLGDAFAGKVLADAVGFKYAYDEGSKQFAHAAVAFVLTPEGRISRYLYGVDVLPRDFRLAMVEAGGGRVGTSLDRLLLTCFRFDPMNRKYAPYVMGFMRIGAGLVFLSLATLLGVLWRKELMMRRKRAAA